MLGGPCDITTGAEARECPAPGCGSEWPPGAPSRSRGTEGQWWGLAHGSQGSWSRVCQAFSESFDFSQGRRTWGALVTLLGWRSGPWWRPASSPHQTRGDSLNVTLRWWAATWGQAPQNCADETLPCLLSGAFCWHVRKQGSGSVHSRRSGSGAWSQKSRRGVGCSLEASFLECRCCLLTMSSRGCPCTCLGPNRLFLKGHQSDWTRAPEGPQVAFVSPLKARLKRSHSMRSWGSGFHTVRGTVSL